MPSDHLTYPGGQHARLLGDVGSPGFLLFVEPPQHLIQPREEAREDICGGHASACRTTRDCSRFSAFERFSTTIADGSGEALDNLGYVEPAPNRLRERPDRIEDVARRVRKLDHPVGQHSKIDFAGCQISQGSRSPCSGCAPTVTPTVAEKRCTTVLGASSSQPLVSGPTTLSICREALPRVRSRDRPG